MKKNKRQTDRVSPISPDYQDERIGDIAVSTAGHDAGLILVVVAGIDDKYVLVADGKRRKLIAPKKKSMLPVIHTLNIIGKRPAITTKNLITRSGAIIPLSAVMAAWMLWH